MNQPNQPTTRTHQTCVNGNPQTQRLQDRGVFGGVSDEVLINVEPSQLEVNSPDIDVITASDGTKYIRDHSLGFINGCLKFMELVVNSDLSYHKGGRVNGGVHSQSATKIAKHFSLLRVYARIYRSGYSYHPLIAFFLESYRVHDICNVGDLGPYTLIGPERYLWMVFDEFVEKMRESAKSQLLKKSIGDWEGKVKKNRRRVIELESKIFQRRSRVTVLRLDLGYKKVTMSAAECIALCQRDEAQRMKDCSDYWSSPTLEVAAPVTLLAAFEQVQKDRNRFFANMKGKPSLFRHLLAYAWRIECTEKSGFHIHLALFYNGSDVHKHEWLGMHLCGYWERNITEGRGRAHNCNAHWSRHEPNYGLGAIERDDQVKRAILRDHVLAYLCKDTQPVHLLPYKGCKLFGSGFFRKDLSKGRGRPPEMAPTSVPVVVPDIRKASTFLVSRGLARRWS